MRQSLVYLATNRVNGKTYIGITSKTLAARKSDHFSRARSLTRKQTHFSQAIRKHGPEAFVFDVLSTWSTYEEALSEEKRIIAALKPNYNITAGGRGILIADRSNRKEWYAKVSAAQKGRSKPVTERMVEANKKAALARTKLKVLCLNDGFLGTIKEAAIRYGLRYRSILSVCRREARTPSIKGYVFIFSDIELPIAERMAQFNQWRNRVVSKPWQKTPIICVTNGERYDGVAVAAKAIGVTPGRIIQLCRDGGKTKEGLEFAYIHGKKGERAGKTL